jgi:hypothetical protein
MEPLPLRDIHLPLPVGFWPLAPGWWIVGIVALMILALALFLLYRHRRPTALKEALAKLEVFLSDAELSPMARNQGISLLLRQLAISTEGRDEIAGLSGSAWIAWLEKRLSNQEMSNAMKQFLEQGPYSRQNEIRTNSPAFRKEITAAFLAVGQPASTTRDQKWINHPWLQKLQDAVFYRFSKRSSKEA